MKRSRTGSSVEKVRSAPSVVNVQMPLPLIDVLADMKTSFFGLCLTAGQMVFEAMMEQDREGLCGPKGIPNPDRRAIRGGSAPSEVVLGGRRISIPRLRARSIEGEELHLPTFVHASARDPLDAYTLEQVAIGVAMRKYCRTLDPLPQGVAERSISKSAVSRRFVALTTNKLTTWLAAPLDKLDIRILFIDGLHFRDHVILLVLGVDSKGVKHVLGLREGTTENATVCKALLADLRQRGLDLDCPALFIIDGGTGLRKAIREACGDVALVHRCHVHKQRNVLEHLPESMRPRVKKAIADAYGLSDPELAKRRLEQLASGLERSHPGAAGSLREGLEETLTLQRLGVSGALYRTLRSTNAIENLNGLVGHFTRNVRRWRDGRMLVRWIASALNEARRSFRRVRGYTNIPKLIQALDRRAVDTKKEVA
ncbi:MAG: IS256 family transposase [Gemmatimonadales bacterium]|nr:MAG: IS256 family transposase [Gemmatimonadales bacterium]